VLQVAVSESHVYDEHGQRDGLIASLPSGVEKGFPRYFGSALAKMGKKVPIIGHLCIRDAW
jgi:hypothetical protein